MAMIRTLTARFAFLALLGAALAGGPPPAARAAEAISEQDAHAIGVTAYTYLYSLVTMDLTRKQLTNVAKAEGISAPMNTFANVPAFPTADMKVVVRPNFDTLYSSAWLDLTKEPMIVSVPDTHGRLLSAADARHVDRRVRLPRLAHDRNPGRRLCRGAAGLERITAGGRGPPRRADALCLDHRPHQDRRPGRLRRRPRDPGGFQDLATVALGQAAEPVVGTVDPDVDMKTPPKIAVEKMPAGEFFAYAAEILKLQPPHITDQPILAQMQRIGIERGKSFDLDKVDPAIKAGLETAPQAALKLMAWKVPSLARVVDGWSLNTDTMGVYGNYYLKRAIVTQFGLGANLPEDAIYPLNLADETGQAAGWGQRLCPAFRQGCHAAGERLLVGHAL